MHPGNSNSRWFRLASTGVSDEDKGKDCPGNRFCREGKAKCCGGIAFAVEEKRNPVREIAFPHWRNDSQAGILRHAPYLIGDPFPVTICPQPELRLMSIEKEILEIGEQVTEKEEQCFDIGNRGISKKRLHRTGKRKPSGGVSHFDDSVAAYSHILEHSTTRLWTAGAYLMRLSLRFCRELQTSTHIRSTYLFS